MKPIHAFLFLFPALIFISVLVACGTSVAKANDTAAAIEDYRCIPCGYDCDTTTYHAPGKCSHCQMVLVKSATIHFKNLPATEVCQYIKDHPETILLDVRTPEEFEGKADPDFGSLKNAINVPVQQLESKLAALAPYKQKQILVYCSHSHRSPQASYLLTQNGFTDVVNMSGGMSVMTNNACKKP